MPTVKDQFNAEDTSQFLDRKTHKKAAFTSDGLSIYRSLAADYNIDSVALGTPTQAGEILPNVHRTIERLKTWIHGMHTFVSIKHGGNLYLNRKHISNRWRGLQCRA